MNWLALTPKIRKNSPTITVKLFSFWLGDFRLPQTPHFSPIPNFLPPPIAICSFHSPLVTELAGLVPVYDIRLLLINEMASLWTNEARDISSQFVACMSPQRQRPIHNPFPLKRVQLAGSIDRAAADNSTVQRSQNKYVSQCRGMHSLYSSVPIQTIMVRHNQTTVQSTKQTVFAARCYASAAYAVIRCPSVRLSVTFVDSVETTKYIFKIFLPSGSHTILVCPHQMSWQYSPPITGALTAGGVDRNHDSEPISGFIACYQRCDRQVLSTQHSTAGPRQLIAGSKRRSLLMARDDDEMFTTRSLNVTPKTTERHLIARNDLIWSLSSNNKTAFEVLHCWS